MDGFWATKGEGVRLIVRAIISFPDFQPIYIYMITIHQRYVQTDRPTDGRRAIARPHFAL